MNMRLYVYRPFNIVGCNQYSKKNVFLKNGRISMFIFRFWWHLRTLIELSV